MSRKQASPHHIWEKDRGLGLTLQREGGQGHG